jgi:hypothetical protein
MQTTTPTLVETPEEPGIWQPGIADPLPGPGELDPPRLPSIDEPYPAPDEDELPSPGSRELRGGQSPPGASRQLSTGELAFSTKMR